MPNWQAITFIAVSLGIALALDVTIFTLLKFRNQELSVTNWILPITLYHMILFGGAYLGLLVFGKIPFAIVLIGLFGGGLIIWLIYEAICTGLGKEPVFSLSEFANKHCNHGGVVWLLPEALAVSWDALLSAPGMFPVLQSFSSQELILGWLVFGATITCLTIFALLGALWLRRFRFHSAQKLAIVAVVAKWLQLSIFGGFAVNSLWHSLHFLTITASTPSETPSFAIGLTLVTCLFLHFRKGLLKEERRIAKEAIGNFC